jgi:hypothetical protein
MSKIICNQVDFVFRYEIESFDNGTVILKSTGGWKTFALTKKAAYRSETSQNDPGPTRRETLSVQTKRNPACVLHFFSNFPIVIRLHTDENVFYMGSLRFPVITEINTDEIVDDYSFECESIP